MKLQILFVNLHGELMINEVLFVIRFYSIKMTQNLKFRVITKYQDFYLFLFFILIIKIISL